MDFAQSALMVVKMVVDSMEAVQSSIFIVDRDAPGAEMHMHEFQVNSMCIIAPPTTVMIWT